MNFIELCGEVGLWSQKNFGDQPPVNPLLGVLEEIGEISHSFLKSQQGIRGPLATHIESMRDGVGDAVIFLADFCSRADLMKSFTGRESLTQPFGEFIVTGTHVMMPKNADARYYLFLAASTLGFIYNNHIEDVRVSYGISIELVIHSLIMFCWMLHISFAECVMTTWELVKQRDWTKNTQTGEVENSATTALHASAVQAVQAFVAEREKMPGIGNKKGGE